MTVPTLRPRPGYVLLPSIAGVIYLVGRGSSQDRTASSASSSEQLVAPNWNALYGYNITNKPTWPKKNKERKSGRFTCLAMGISPMP